MLRFIILYIRINSIKYNKFIFLIPFPFPLVILLSKRKKNWIRIHDALHNDHILIDGLIILMYHPFKFIGLEKLVHNPIIGEILYANNLFFTDHS